MIGTIRRHSKWLWLVIITATIVSFVIFFTPNAGDRSRRGGSPQYGSIDGIKISQEDYAKAYRETELRYFLSTGTWPDASAKKNGFDEMVETYKWLFFIQKMGDYNIHVDPAATAQMGQNILQKFGRGQPLSVDQFVNNILVPRRISLSDFQRYIEHDLGLQQLISVVGLSGELITPQQAESLYKSQNQALSTEAVFFSASNYLSQVSEPTPEALAAFYTNMAAAYRVPERVQLSYVSFELSNYTAKAEQQLTNLSELVEMNMRDMGTNYTQFGKTAEEARAKVRDLLLRKEAAALAQPDVDRFATALFEMEPLNAGNLAALARTNGLQVKVTAPFDLESGPQEINAGPNFAREAFSRNADEPFAGPVLGENAIYIVALDKRIPSEVPPLSAIHDRVLADYKRREATQLARRAGAEFEQAVRAGSAAGKTFDAVCAEAKIKPVSIPAVSPRTEELPELGNHVRADQYAYLAARTPPGKASDFTPTLDGGLVVYVRERLPIDQAKMKLEMPAFVRSLRQERRMDAINMWLNRELNQGLQDTLLQKQADEARQPRQSPS